MSNQNVEIEESWKQLLSAEFEQPYFNSIKEFIVNERKKGKTTYPPGNLIFNAFNQTTVENTKVIIIGQDPYHGPNQAHGLCFSVQHGIKPPPSLKNIFQEIKADLNIDAPNHGNLESWAKQGVLLLNAFLTVNAHEPASHKKAGWETFTNAVIKKLSDEKENLVFLLWGRFAQNKQALIDQTKHHILMAAHPSPFSAHNGFFGCKHFSKTNEILQKQGLPMIGWELESV